MFFSGISIYILLRHQQLANQSSSVLQQFTYGEFNEIRTENVTLHVSTHSRFVYGGGDHFTSADFRGGHTIPKNHDIDHSLHDFCLQSIRGRR